MRKGEWETALELLYRDRSCLPHLALSAPRSSCKVPREHDHVGDHDRIQCLLFGVPRPTHQQPQRESHSTSFWQRNASLGVQQRVQLSARSVERQVGDLPDQDRHLSSKDEQMLGRCEAKTPATP
jgi:hypothetical protein